MNENKMGRRRVPPLIKVTRVREEKRENETMERNKQSQNLTIRHRLIG